MSTHHSHPRPALWRVNVVRCVEWGSGPTSHDWQETDHVVATAWGRTAEDAAAEGELAAAAWSAREAGFGEHGRALEPARVSEATCDDCGDWCEPHELTVVEEGGIDGEAVPLCAHCGAEREAAEAERLIDLHDADDRVYDEALQRAADFKGVA